MSKKIEVASSYLAEAKDSLKLYNTTLSENVTKEISKELK
ncbi:hypothetical protein M901_2351 [Bacteriovorax sp. DB6_IX]|nr:hypothetical protein M901_2351 [Bacteriovorax sp. DB6_IX]